MKRAMLLLFTATALLASGAAFVQAQAPPLGPPLPTAPIHDMSVPGILTRLVRGQVDQALASTNAAAASNPDVHATVSLNQFNVYGPSRWATQNYDRPNEWFVKVSYSLEYKVHDIQKHTDLGWISVPIERYISQDIDVQTLCDRWQTGQGNLNVVANPQPLYLEDQQGALEEVINFFIGGFLTRYIDSQIRQHLPGALAPASLNLPGQCDALGASGDTIQWSFHPSPRRVVTLATPYEQISVKLLSLKRLVAHDLSGAPVYSSLEAPALEVYVNQQRAYVAPHSLQEGQQVTLTAPPLVLKRPGNSESLAVIVNVIQTGSAGAKDSATNVFGQSSNFGNGTQTLRTQKSYWIPASGGKKPQKMYVDGYEVTFQVQAPLPEMNPGTATSPGGTRPGGVGPGTIAPMTGSPPTEVPPRVGPHQPAIRQ